MRRSALLSIALFLVPAPAAAGGDDVCVVRRASLDAAGNPTSDHSRKPSISAAGQFVVFESEATNLWIGDTNGVRDVFVHDRAGLVTRLVTLAITGGAANGPSGAGGLWRGSAISGDGTLVAFQSGATDLVGGDTNGTSDVFVHVLATGATSRVSYRPTPNGPIQSNGSSQDPALSHDGRFVAFSSAASNLVTGDGNGTRDIFVFDRLLVAIQRASLPVVGNEAHGECYQPSLSADGTRVAFESFATDLVPGDANGVIDVFLRDLATATTERASLGWMGQEANNYAYRCSLSGDGTRVAFTSAASNLVPVGNGTQTVYVRDLVASTTERWGEDANGSTGFAGSDEASFTTDGRTMAFMSLAALVADDTNGKIDVYHRRCGPTGTPYCAGFLALCPCANGGTGQAGCENSYATGGGLLLAQGMPRVSLDTVTLLATGLPPWRRSSSSRATPRSAAASACPSATGCAARAGRWCASARAPRARAPRPSGTASAPTRRSRSPAECRPPARRSATRVGTATRSPSARRTASTSRTACASTGLRDARAGALHRIQSSRLFG